MERREKKKIDFLFYFTRSYLSSEQYFVLEKNV